MNPARNNRIIDPQGVIDKDEARAEKARSKREAWAQGVTKRIAKRIIKKLDKHGKTTFLAKGGRMGLLPASYDETIYNNVRERLQKSGNDIEFDTEPKVLGYIGSIDNIKVSAINGREVVNEENIGIKE